MAKDCTYNTYKGLKAGCCLLLIMAFVLNGYAFAATVSNYKTGESFSVSFGTESLFLAVTAVSPAPNAVDVAPTTPVTLTFDADVDPATVISENIIIRGQQSGPLAGSWSVTGQEATFTPTEEYVAGEVIHVEAGSGVQSTLGVPLETKASSFTVTPTSQALGQYWVQTETPPDGYNWRSVTYGNGRFVAVGSSMTGAGRVMYSEGGQSWTDVAAAENNSWESVTYGNGRFVAVAESGGSNRVMYSEDGQTWTSAAAAENNSWESVTYGNGRFVAVVGSGTNRVMYSEDGQSWTAAAAAEANAWTSVTYGNGRFVAVAVLGTNRVMYSEDGQTWTGAAAAENNRWLSVTYGNGRFVAVAEHGVNQVMYSEDGQTWTGATAAEANLWTSVTYGNGRFMAVAGDGANPVMYSEDGETWTSVSLPHNRWSSVTYGKERFVMVASSGAAMYSTEPPRIASLTPKPGADDFINRKEFTVTIEFSKEIANFDLGGIKIENATATGFTTDDHRTFEVAIEADDITTSSSTITVEVLEAVFEDPNGFPLHNLTHNPVYTVKFGDIRPTVAFSTSFTGPAGPGPIPVTLTFNERFDQKVSGFEVDDIITENVVHVSVSQDKNPVFELEITPAGEGPVTLSLPENVVSDAAGNGNEASAPFSMTHLPGLPAAVIPEEAFVEARSVALKPGFAWQAAEGADIYRFELSLNDSFDDPIVIAGDLTETSYQLEEELDYFGTYYWRVRSENSAGAGEWSPTGMFTTLAETPEPRFPVDQAQNISIAPHLSWDSPYEEGSYEIRLATDAGMTGVVEELEVDSTGFAARGLDAHTEYFWQVRFLSNQTTSEWSPPQAFATRADPVPGQAAMIFATNQFKSSRIESEDYRMFSLPGSQKVNLAAVLGDGYGDDWRAFADTGSDEDFLDEYDPESNPLVFSPGLGFWVFHRDSVQISLNIEPVEVGEEDDYGIELHPGWNIIANPYSMAVKWDDVLELNGIKGILYEYNHLFNSSDNLMPFTGYYFYNDPEWNLDQLRIPYVNLEKRRTTTGMAAKLLASREESGKAGNIRLQAHFRDHKNGQQAVTRVSWDFSPGYMDSPYPPLNMSRYGVAFAPEEGTGLYRNIGGYYDDAGTEYELKIKAPVGQSLQWEAEFAGLGEDARVLLINPVSFQSQLLGDGDTAEIRITEPELTWKVYVGDKIYLQEIQENLVPDVVTLRHNYPNPFYATTHINYSLNEELDVRLEVFDILGRRVRTLVNAQQPEGWYSVVFDGRDLASGVYMCRLIAGNTVLTKKMMFIK